MLETSAKEGNRSLDDAFFIPVVKSVDAMAGAKLLITETDKDGSMKRSRVCSDNYSQVRAAQRELRGLGMKTSVKLNQKQHVVGH